MILTQYCDTHCMALNSDILEQLPNACDFFTLYKNSKHSNKDKGIDRGSVGVFWRKDNGA